MNVSALSIRNRRDLLCFFLMKERQFTQHIFETVASWFDSSQWPHGGRGTSDRAGQLMETPGIVDARYRQRRAAVVRKQIERGYNNASHSDIERLQFSIWLGQTPSFSFALYRWPTKKMDLHAPIAVRFYAAYNCYGKPQAQMETFFADPARQEQLVALPNTGPLRIILDGNELTLHKYYERSDSTEAVLTYLDCLSDLADALE